MEGDGPGNTNTTWLIDIDFKGYETTTGFKLTILTQAHAGITNHNDPLENL